MRLDSATGGGDIYLKGRKKSGERAKLLQEHTKDQRTGGTERSRRYDVIVWTSTEEAQRGACPWTNAEIPLSSQRVDPEK